MEGVRSEGGVRYEGGTVEIPPNIALSCTVYNIVKDFFGNVKHICDEKGAL